MCTNNGDNSKSVFARIVALFGLRICSEILIFKFKRDWWPYILDKSSHSRVLAPACGALVYICINFPPSRKTHNSLVDNYHNNLTYKD